jgi:saccharopine dehydrogenase-like NADP-dependent oxidoreductase
MTTYTHETDYLIVGSGAVGMAFADILLTESDANIIIVDRLLFMASVLVS